MRARAYANQYQVDLLTVGPEKAITNAAQRMMVETKKLMQIRHVSTAPGFVAIIKETDKKWRAFVRMSGDETIRPDGFLRLAVRTIPELQVYFPNVKSEVKHG